MKAHKSKNGRRDWVKKPQSAHDFQKNNERFNKALNEILSAGCPLCRHNEGCKSLQHGQRRSDENPCLDFDPVSIEDGIQVIMNKAFPGFEEVVSSHKQAQALASVKQSVDTGAFGHALAQAGVSGSMLEQTLAYTKQSFKDGEK